MTKPDRCVLFDKNNNQVIFLKQTLINVKKSETRYEFLIAMKEYLNLNNNIKNIEYARIIKDHGYNPERLKPFVDSIHKSCLLFWPNISSDPSYYNYNIHGDIMDEISYELRRKDSWLSTDTNYNYIRNLVLTDKIAILCEDITNISTFKYMKIQY
jgi:hypothetical protein